MYTPDRDMRITKSDSALEYQTKGLLMEAFAKYRARGGSESLLLQDEIVRLELVLREETTRQIREYENGLAGTNKSLERTSEK